MTSIETVILAGGLIVAVAGLVVTAWSISYTRKKYYQEYLRRKRD